MMKNALTNAVGWMTSNTSETNAGKDSSEMMEPKKSVKTMKVNHDFAEFRRDNEVQTAQDSGESVSRS